MLATTTTSNNDDYYYLHYYTTQTEDIGKSEFVILKGSHVIMLATTMTDFLPIFFHAEGHTEDQQHVFKDVLLGPLHGYTAQRQNDGKREKQVLFEENSILPLPESLESCEW